MFPRPFFILYAAVFVATLGISMVSPLLPVYAEELGATGVWIGLTFSSFAITYTLFGPFIGRWSDRYARKPFIVAGLLLYLVAAIGYLTADSFLQVMAFRALSGLGTSLIFSVARAYVGEMVPEGHEGRWFGLFATADIVGFGSGPLIAGVLRQTLGFDSVFVAMALLMASSAVIVFTLLPARPPRPERAAVADDGAPDRPLMVAVRDRLTSALTLHQAFFSLSWGSVLSFLAVRLEHDLLIGPALIGLAFGVENLASGASQPLMGRLVDRGNRTRLVAIGLLATAAGVFSIGFANQYWLVIVILLGMGASGALSQVAGGALQIVAGRRVGLGSVIGLGAAGSGIGILVGSVLGGLFVDVFGVRAAFFFGGITMAAGTPLFLWLARGAPQHEHEVVLLEGAEPSPAGGG